LSVGASCKQANGGCWVKMASILEEELGKEKINQRDYFDGHPIDED